jgi:branched-chain amino acid transport system permease protein
MDRMAALPAGTPGGRRRPERPEVGDQIDQLLERQGIVERRHLRDGGRIAVPTEPVASGGSADVSARAPARPSRAMLGAGLAALALVPMPVLLPPYPLIELCYALALGIACLGLNLVYGTTGLLSLGHAAYFGLGAYAGAFVFNVADLQSLEVYLLLGVITATAAAAVAGAWCVRATRIHFTILTLAFGQLVQALFVTGAVYRPLGDYGKGLFYVGYGGLYIPRFTILGTDPAPERFVATFYYVILVAFFLALGALWRVSRSPFGMALRAIRDNDVRAAFVGIPVRAYRWRAFVLSGAITGLAGGLYGQLDRQVTPEQLGWLFSAKLVVATIIGGTQWFLGPVVGAAVFVALQHVANRFALSHGLILAGLLLAVVFACPGGIVEVTARGLGWAARPGWSWTRPVAP